MKKLFVRLGLLLIVALAIILPLQTSLSQDSPPTRPVTLEINGVDSTQLPQAVVSVAVLDSLGQPVEGLTAADFTLSGELADRAQIVSVENVTDNNLAFGVVLAIDISSSMAGAPIDQAKAAATAFVDSIGPSDPVSIVTFGNDVQVVQDFTSDKDVLRNAIASIQFGGETNLYDGSVGSIEQAAAAPVPRHTVIILSDGAHYLVQGTAQNSRETALNTALTQGVPVYTIGLGYGTDRTYLQALAEGTNATYFESPTPEQLVEIYTNLAALFRSLYIVTLNVDVPLDGTEYTLEMQANTSFGQSTVGQGTLRAPIPVPLVSIEPVEPAADSPANTLAFNVNVVSDEPLTGGQYTLVAGDGAAAAPVPFAAAAAAGANQFPLTFDPFVQAPGSTTLRVEVTDETGDVGTAETEIEIPALPAVVSVSPDLGTLGELSDLTTVTVDLQEQSPTSSVQFFVDDQLVSEDTEAPFTFDLDPASFPPGEHTLAVNVESASGATALAEQTFTAAALPPEITVSGLTNGEVLEEARAVDVEVGGRVPVQSVTYSVDGNVIDTQDEAPFSVDLQPLSFVPDQTLTLRIEAANAFGTTNAVEIPFSFSMSPFLTATPPTSTPTPTATPTIDVPATNAAASAVAQTTLDAQATSDTLSTATAVVEATSNAIATDNAVSTENAAIASTATFEAEVTGNALATLNAEATLAQNTLEAQNTATAELAQTQEQATANAQSTQDRRTEVAVTANAVAEVTQTAQASTEALETEIAATEELEATTNAQSTTDAEATSVSANTAATETAVDEQTATESAATGAAETEIALTEEVVTQAASTEAAETDTAATEVESTSAAEQRSLSIAATQTATAEIISTNVARTQAAATEVIETEAAGTNVVSTDTASTKIASTAVEGTNVVSTEAAATENAITEVAALQLSASPTGTPTEEPTETATEEVTAELTEEATSTPTEAATEDVTEEITEEATDEQTPLATVSTLEPTATTGAPQEVVQPGSAQTLQDQLPTIVVCGGLILLLILILLVVLSRRRRNV